jgi:hypothetical protein
VEEGEARNAEQFWLENPIGRNHSEDHLIAGRVK